MSKKQLINNLLYEEESATLDFKSEQYKFTKAEDKKKAELLKDVIAFCNAWRQSDAYILIGVEEIKGEKSKIVGISDDLDDAQIQQFIQTKINVPINFAYETCQVDEVKLALITIPLQTRPVYLKKDYANLKANTVYIRRGSSTAVALPDEIAEMGKAKEQISHRAPKLRAFFSCGTHGEEQVETINGITTLVKIPNSSLIPKFGSVTDPSNPFHRLQLTDPFRDINNENYYLDFAKYRSKIFSFFTLNIGVKNIGNSVAHDVKMVVDFNDLPSGSVIFHQNKIPEAPSKQSINLEVFKPKELWKRDNLDISKTQKGYRVTIYYGKLHTQDNQVCPECICVQVLKTCTIKPSVTVFSDNLEAPEKMDLRIDIDSQVETVSVDEIIEFASKSSN